MQELIGSVMISSLLLPTFGTLSLLLYFRLPSKGRSITTLGTRWHDVFYYKGIVTGWGCTFCLHTVVGEGRYHKDFLNPLPGPKPRSAVCGHCRP